MTKIPPPVQLISGGGQKSMLATPRDYRHANGRNDNRPMKDSLSAARAQSNKTGLGHSKEAWKCDCSNLRRLFFKSTLVSVD